MDEVLVVGASGEGIYWAMKSAKMAAETLIESLPDLSARALRRYERTWWKRYGTMYRFLRWLQRWGYGSPRQMEVFTDMCRNKDVQQLTFESYMHKTMTPVPWLAQMCMTGDILAAQVRHYLPGFLPEHLQFLRSFLTKKPMNAFFPLSVTVSTVITALLLRRAFAAGASEFEAIGYTFLGFLMALAILEHWLLVLPMPNKIWNWGLKSRGQLRPTDVEVVVGFLGAGKTTFLRRMLALADPNVRTVVLVNDFGAVGVDSALLNGRGADVVELPNGCICCSLRNDLATQIRDVVARFAPARLLIEPSGVAEVAALLRVLDRPDLADAVKSVRVYTLIDAGAFLREYARMPQYFEAQANAAPLLIVNKADLATPAELQTVEQTLRALNPQARIVPASYGVVEKELLAAEATSATRHSHADAADAEHHEHAAELGFNSWSCALPGVYDESALRELLHAAADGAFGELLRAKGIAQVRRGWVHFDLAGGQISVAAFAPRDGEQPRAMAIGPTIRATDLEAALAGCRAAAGEGIVALAPAT